MAPQPASCPQVTQALQSPFLHNGPGRLGHTAFSWKKRSESVQGAEEAQGLHRAFSASVSTQPPSLSLEPRQVGSAGMQERD